MTPTVDYRLKICYTTHSLLDKQGSGLFMKKQIQMLAIFPLSLFSFFGIGSQNQIQAPTQAQTQIRAQAQLQPSAYIKPIFVQEQILGTQEMPLNDRYPVKSVNDVFRDNILLNLAYMEGTVKSSKDIKWDEITKPFRYEFRLDPDKTFAYHEDVKDIYKDSLVKTTNANFNFSDGFKSDGYLYGDGVCHLASLINWAARTAGLAVEAPTNHNFANIPDVPKEFGVSIFKNPGAKSSNALQNLYIKNNRSKPITFRFEYANDKLKVSVVEFN